MINILILIKGVKVKKNKLTLSAGILLIITASISILNALNYIESLFDFYFETEVNFGDLGLEYNLMIESVVAVIIGLILVETFQAITFMILGVKIVKRTNKKVPFNEMKPMVITALVFSSIGILYNFSINNPILIAIVVLLACALAKGDVKVNKNEVRLDSESKLDSDLLVEKVQVLKDLKEKGVINNEEFETMLAKVTKITEEKEEKKY